MRLAWITLAIAACTGAHPPATDRLDCISCHSTEFASVQAGDFPVSTCTTKPVHDAAPYSTRCYECHGTAGWCPAVDPNMDTKRHGVFRIATGSHAGYDCGDCHVARVVGQSLAGSDAPQPMWCTTCHTHDQARTDAHHLSNGDYKYTPTSCLADGCHGGGNRQ